MSMWRSFKHIIVNIIIIIIIMIKWTKYVKGILPLFVGCHMQLKILELTTIKIQLISYQLCIVTAENNLT